MVSSSDRFVRTPNVGPGRYALGIRAVILDWAGTCVDFGSCAPAATFVEAFAKHGVIVTPAEARAPMGMAKREHIQAIAASSAVAAQWKAAHKREFSEGDIDAVYETFLPLQESCVERFSSVIPGAVETLAWLRSKSIRVGSSTGYTREIMDRVMRVAMSQGFQVETMVCATDFPQGRPWPWMIFENMKRLGVCPPSSCIVVDDTVVGVQAGVNAGTWSVGVAATGNLVGLSLAEFESLPDAERHSRLDKARAALEDAGAHYVIDSIGELPRVIADIQGRMAG
ncbi:MAG: phosphonoacetaldehyde hydrolase [Tepidisphaera sp.]|nr:phosphonoacetaldehyde hydrolase [Tepidisphaera sp.]